ncbi:MAG TPA: hypothetical protein VGK87_09460, partial [Anaerolineae bacterium]
EHLAPYHPERIAIWATRSYGAIMRQTPLWPITSIRLSDLADDTSWGFPKKILLEGRDATMLYDRYLRNAPWFEGTPFAQSKSLYRVGAVALLPLESFDAAIKEGPRFNATRAPAEKPITLSCTPSDGVMTIP